MLLDRAAWTRNVCEKIFTGRNPIFILDQCHALEPSADAVQTLDPDKGEQEVWTEEVEEQLNDGQDARGIDGLKPNREPAKAVATCIDCFKDSKD